MLQKYGAILDEYLRILRLLRTNFFDLDNRAKKQKQTLECIFKCREEIKKLNKIYFSPHLLSKREQKSIEKEIENWLKKPKNNLSKKEIIINEFKRGCNKSIESLHTSIMQVYSS